MSGVMAVTSWLTKSMTCWITGTSAEASWLMTWPIIDTICEATGSSAAMMSANGGSRLDTSWPMSGMSELSAFMSGSMIVGMSGASDWSMSPNTGMSSATEAVITGMTCLNMSCRLLPNASNFGFIPAIVFLNRLNAPATCVPNASRSSGTVAMSVPIAATTMPIGPVITPKALPNIVALAPVDANSPPIKGNFERSPARPEEPSTPSAAVTGAKMLPKFLNTSPIAVTAFWNGAGSRSTRLLNSEGIAETTPLAMAPIRGRMFFNAVPMESASCWLRAPMSAFSLPSPASQFCHAAFIMPMEPSMVFAASSAVVPVMPI